MGIICSWRDQTGCMQMQIDSYTRTQTEQSGKVVILVPTLNNLGRRPQELSGNGDSDRLCTVYMNEQHRYGFRP